MSSTVKMLQTSGAKVGIVDDIYNFDFDIQRCKYRRPLGGGYFCTVPLSVAEEQFFDYMSVLNDVHAEIQDVLLFEIRRVLCTSVTCTMLNEDVMAYRDRHHLSANGSRIIGKALSDKILSMQ